MASSSATSIRSGVEHCANCQVELTKSETRKIIECGRCKKERVAQPAYYCGEQCAKRHWKEHKLWHMEAQSKLRKEVESKKGEYFANKEGLAKCAASGDPVDVLVARALMLLDPRSDEYNCRDAVKLATKALKLDPMFPWTHLALGEAASQSSDRIEALPHFLKAMELSDKGSDFQRDYSHRDPNIDGMWAQCTAKAFMCIENFSAEEKERIDPALLPAWWNDYETLKKMSDRMMLTLPDEGNTLVMRAIVYEYQEDPSAADLRLAIHARRRSMEEFEPGSGAARREAQRINAAEAKLRARITADVAAAREREIAKSTFADSNPLQQLEKLGFLDDID